MKNMFTARKNVPLISRDLFCMAGSEKDSVDCGDEMANVFIVGG